MTPHRMFPHDAPRITFTKDFRRIVHGDLLPGRSVTVSYDAERLPNERSKENGEKAWTIKCFYKFLEQGEVWSRDMWSETGETLTKVTNEIGEGTMLVCQLELPPDADHLTLWFLNTGESGAEFWDSNFGRNYVFRFVANDLEIVSAKVDSDDRIPSSQFRVEVMASPEVDSLAVSYRITNDPAALPDQFWHLELKPEGPTDSFGRRKWSSSTPVASEAVIGFSFIYNSYGNPHTDTNSGTGYVTWKGAQRNLEAGIP